MRLLRTLLVPLVGLLTVLAAVPAPPAQAEGSRAVPHGQWLLDPHGKEQLAAEIAREAVRPMGIDIPAPLPAASAPAGGGEAAAAIPAKRPQVKNPIRHVNFSSFIIQ